MEGVLQQVTQKMEQLVEVAKTYSLQQEQKELEQLSLDLTSNEYSIVVVGEFNHGKSSFVNALLGQTILPVGIIPTTATINAIHYAEKPMIAVRYQDEEEQQMPYSEQLLTQFIASNENQVQQVDYIRIGVNLPLLKNDLLVIDTPGLNDVNDLRSEVTYSFMPRADVVFFMLHINKPLNRTEIEFLRDGLLQQGLDRIVFIVNFIDQVDEDELEQTLQIIEMRLKMALGFEQVTLLPISAIEALQAKRDNDHELLALSGIEAVEQKMHEMCTSGSLQQEKNERYEKRLQQIQEAIERQLILLEAAYQEDSNTREQQLEKFEQWKASELEREEQLLIYIAGQQNTILMMTHKSINYFFQGLERRVEEKIEMFSGSNIKSFFGKEIPVFLKYQIKQWVETYSPQLNLLFYKLEQEISKSMTEAFKEIVHISTTQSALNYEQTTEIIVGEKKDPILTSSLLVGGASTIMLAVGVPIFLPILGVVALPFLQKKLVQKQLDELKPTLKLETIYKMQEVRANFTFEMEKYVRNSIHQMTKQTMETLSTQQQQVMDNIESIQKEVEDDQISIQKKVEAILQTLQHLRS